MRAGADRVKNGHGVSLSSLRPLFKQFNLDVYRHSNAFRAYGPGTVTVTIPWDGGEGSPDAVDAIGPSASRMSQEVQPGSMIVTPEHLIRAWPPQSLAELAADHKTALESLKPVVVLLGSGARFILPETAALAPLMQAGIGYEVMDTAAACRTYNILMSVGRRVAAALLLTT